MTRNRKTTQVSTGEAATVGRPRVAVDRARQVAAARAGEPALALAVEVVVLQLVVAARVRAVDPAPARVARARAVRVQVVRAQAARAQAARVQAARVQAAQAPADPATMPASMTMMAAWSSRVRISVSS